MPVPFTPARKTRRPSESHTAVRGATRKAVRRPRPQPSRRARAAAPAGPRRWVCDLGNTLLRFGEIRNASVVLRLELPSREPERLCELRDLFRETDRGGSCHISSVFPPANGPLETELAAFGIRPVIADPALHRLMPHRLKTPASTGADRLLAARAAWDRVGLVCREMDCSPAGVAVVLAGTALVVDWVDHEGVFRGGYIMPGPSMWLSSLAGAAMLPKLVVNPDRPWAEDTGNATRSALRHGMTVGLRGAAAEAVAAIRRQASRPDIPVVLDGGWARELAPAFGHDAILSPLLVLDGLRLWAQESPKP